MPAARNRVIENGTGETCVVTFRVPTARVTKLAGRMKKRPIIGIRSTHQFARKLFMDFVDGRVVYLNPSDMSKDPALTS